MSSPAPESPRPAASEEPSDSARRYRRALYALLLALITAWLLMLAPLPLSLGAGIAGLVAAVLLVRMVIAAWRDGRRPMAIVSAAIGFPAIASIVLGAVLGALFYGPMSELERCQSRALTHEAQRACQEDVQSSVVSWLEGIGG
ncbi:hypothetical protein Bequi_05470 [Brachybacterium sp. JHP9]|uniref:AI-2E family transporter n=1 Tax=Brachybacterium equifaecis TaxID=2910770 RepID=A0ABT0R0N7_9MICO|nr:hypothetical protein [Brachybacterium equifaecis]MCL6422839.1 hypothetical protein [Brachybacterium equifaecis]